MTGKKYNSYSTSYKLVKNHLIKDSYNYHKP